MSTAGGRLLEAAITAARSDGRPAIAAFLTSGYPSPGAFPQLLAAVSEAATIVEVGMPFSDPMADGVTIQQSSRHALECGVTLAMTLGWVEEVQPAAPVVLMSYLNPLLAYGLAPLATDARRAGVSGVIVPDLPLEECDPLAAALREREIALIQLVTPATSEARLRRLCAASGGFVYAVTITGTTGTRANITPDRRAYLDRVRAISQLPVLAGFGVRDAEQVREIMSVVDGFVVGSALIDALSKGEDPVSLLRELSSAVPPTARFA